MQPFFLIAEYQARDVSHYTSFTIRGIIMGGIVTKTTGFRFWRWSRLPSRLENTPYVGSISAYYKGCAGTIGMETVSKICQTANTFASAFAWAGAMSSPPFICQRKPCAGIFTSLERPGAAKQVFSKRFWFSF